MPYVIIHEAHGVLVKWWGHASSADVVRMQEQAHANPNYDQFRYSIHDFSECVGFSCDLADMEYSAAIDAAAARINQRVKVAVVTNLPEVLQAAQAYWDNGLSPYPIRTFSTLEDARTWVAVAP